MNILYLIQYYQQTMTINNDKNYQDFFRDELYGRFVAFLRNKLGCATVIALIGDDPIFNKRGVHLQLRRLFNEFLSKYPGIEKIFTSNDQKCYLQRNIAGEALRFPIDVNDEQLMVTEDLRNPAVIPVDWKDIPRAGKNIKNVASPMRKRSLKGDLNSKKFLIPRKLIVHYKRGFAVNVKHKTTEVFFVESKEDISTILFDTYKDKVAFAQCEKMKFQFVKYRSNGKNKKDS